MIPIFSLHRDAYPQPEKFDPNRFLSSRSGSISSSINSGMGSYKAAFNQNQNQFNEKDTKMPYLPFGDGPRACIGRRFAKMLIKVGIAAILQKCSIELDDHLNIENEFQFITPFGAFLRPQAGLKLRFKPRKVLVSTQRTDFLDMIDQFSPGESEFSRAVRAAQPMRPIPKSRRPTLGAYPKRMSLR